MNANHESMLYGVVRLLENIASDTEVTLGDVHQAINDIYSVINENTDSSSANTVEDPMLFKFSDYYKSAPTFPKGAV